MLKKLFTAIAVVSVLAAAAVVMYRKAGAGDAQTATLVQIKGKVLFLPAGGSEWKVASERMSVSQGEKIRTSGESSVILKLSDGSMIKIGSLSHLSLDGIVRKDNGTETKINVLSGKAWTRVRKLDRESAFRVQTPTAVAGVRGTFFTSEASEEKSVFDVFDGEVAVSGLEARESAVSVKASQRSEVASGRPPTAPAAIPAEEEEEGRNGFTDQEYINAAFDIQVSINPQIVKPGENARVSVQVFKDGVPYQQELSLRLSISGSAVFDASGTSVADIITDSKGAASLTVTDSVEESVAVQATMIVKVTK